MRPKQLGGKLTSEFKEAYSRSPQWKKRKFYNYERTGVDIGIADLPKLLYRQLFDKKGRGPLQPLLVVQFDKEAFLAADDKPKFVWFGHSVVLIRINSKTILIDPMFGSDAAPISPFSVKRFSENTLDIIEQLPHIDLVLLTHDHYDHLDMASIELLRPKVSQYYVALGAARHLERWGIAADIIQEFDWYESARLENIKITYTPTRHASGRLIADQSCCLWGGWAIKSDAANIWFSGDGGYGAHFKEIGEKLGPFDFAFMECGQYNDLWHQIHLHPEESVQAAIDAQAQKVMPVHWAGFALAMHHWKDPVKRFTAEAKRVDLTYVTPHIGEVFGLNFEGREKWWDTLD